MCHFFLTGKLVWSNTGRSIKIYVFDGEQLVFVGLVTPKSLALLLQHRIPQTDISKYTINAEAAQVHVPKHLLEGEEY